MTKLAKGDRINSKPRLKRDFLKLKIMMDRPELLRKPQITRELLLRDNSSSLAVNKRRTWYEARREGRLVVIRACSDAREELPDENFVHFRSVAASGPIAPYSPIMGDQTVMAVMYLSHQLGDASDGKPPVGCGGRLALASILNGDTPDIKADSVQRFVSKHVKDSDVIIQTWYGAESIADRVKVPVLGASMNHLTLRVYPFVQFQDGGRLVHKAVSTRYLFGRTYNPKRIYGSGMPELREYELIPVFAKIVSDINAHAEDEKSANPSLEGDQAVQDAQALLITSALKPHSIRYPNTLGKRGVTFVETLPRVDIDDHSRITEDDLEDAINQAEYAVTHAITNNGRGIRDFANLDTILIETRELALSKNIAVRALCRDWMKRFMELSNKQILVAAEKSGVIERMELFSIE